MTEWNPNMTMNSKRTNYHHGIPACLLTLLILPTAYAQDVADPAVAESQTRVEETLQELKSHPAGANDARTAKAIERLKELGELGPDAAPALPFLLSDEFYKSVAQKDSALKQATIETLIRIGEPAISAVVGLLKPSAPPKAIDTPGESSSNKLASKQEKRAASRAKKAKEARVAMARDVLLHMARTEAVDMIIPALAKQMQAAPQRQEFYPLLALMGPKSIPVLQQEARDLAAKKNLNKADANNIRRLGELLGEETGSAIDAVLPDRFIEDTWSNDRYWIHYGGGFWPLAHAKPDLAPRKLGRGG